MKGQGVGQTYGRTQHYLYKSFGYFVPFLSFSFLSDSSGPEHGDWLREESDLKSVF